MRTHARHLVTAALCTALMAVGASATEPGAKDLFYDPSKALFGGGSTGTKIRPETDPGHDFTSQNTGGRGGVTGYYDKLENPGVMYYIELVQPGSNAVKRVSNNRVFKSGDRIRIRVTTNSDGFVYALHKGASGGSKLLPVSTGGNVSTGTETVIPSDGGWLRFDANKGIEKVDLVFAARPAGVSEGLVPASAGPETTIQKVQAVVDLYGGSKSLVSYTEAGEKDLVVEPGGGGGAVAAAPVSINRSGAGDFQVDVATASAPGSYFVNTASEPVVLNIQLEHQ